MQNLSFINTNYFREPALHFIKHGFYCGAPEDSYEYNEYWEEEERRCIHGYTVGNITITGKHYWYLNFCPIKVSQEDENGNPIPGEKLLQFPRFWELDYHWWWQKELSWLGTNDMALLKKLGIPGLAQQPITPGRNLTCVKTRRAGFSYKEAAEGTWNFHFRPNSKSYYFAANEQYLIVDGILNKSWDMLEHQNQNTEGWWWKNRMKKNELMHVKASYIDKDKNEKGYKSEILGVIVNNPNKVRGKDGLKITYEEAGSFKGLKESLDISIPSVRDGNIVTGQISVFGTGGEEGASIEGLDFIFNNPHAYYMLPFNNVWEEGLEGTECGFFVPNIYAFSGFMDKDGNINKAAALAYDDEERDLAKATKDPKKYDRRIAEYPRNPSEALMRFSFNKFPVAELKAQLVRVQKDANIRSAIKYGEFVEGKFKLNPDCKPILTYPHNQQDNLDGAVTIYYPPELLKNTNRPDPDRYYITVDPYYKDDSASLTSLYVAYVWEHRYSAKGEKTSSGDRLVASYIGRPDKLNTAYRNTINLSTMYASKIQSEIAGGGKGLYDFCFIYGYLDRLEFEPELSVTREFGANPRNRAYFMNISTEDVILGMAYLTDWLVMPRGFFEDGSMKMNLHEIYDEAWLLEMIKFNPKGNADRISSAIVAMFMRKQREVIIEHSSKKSDTGNKPSFWSRQLHTGGAMPNSSGFIGLSDYISN